MLLLGGMWSVESLMGVLKVWKCGGTVFGVVFLKGRGWNVEESEFVRVECSYWVKCGVWSDWWE